MSGLANHQFQIARGFSLLPACAIGRPAHPSSLGRAATLNDTQRQTWMHTERGLLVGMCAPALGVAKTGRRFAGLGCFSGFLPLFDLPVTGGGFGPRIFPALSHFDGIGAVAAVPVASLIHHRRERAIKALRQRLPSHLSAPGFNAFKTSDGARGSVPVRAGKLPFERGERPHVGHG